MTGTYRGFHFTEHETTGRDGWPLQQVERVQTPVVICERGLHAGTALEALRNAPGPWVSWVSLGGQVVREGDKAAGSTRIRLAGPADASRVLREFACDCAARALLREREAGREPDPRSWEAIAVARRFAAGEATPAEMAAAGAAAAAAWTAAWAAAGAAGAAWAAAWTAAWTAGTVGGGAWAAVWTAAGAAECGWQEAELDRRLKLLLGVKS